MSPDPSGLQYANPANPQSLNLYSYALNNPLKFTDPTGMYCDYGNTDVGEEDQDFHSSQSECEGGGGTWTNDAYTHQNDSGDWVDADNRPNDYTGQLNQTPGGSLSPDLKGAVDGTLNDVQQIGFDLPGIQNYTSADVYSWANKQTTPNGPTHPIKNTLGIIYWHGNWCGSGGNGAPVDATDAACMVHDFLYAQYHFSAWSSNYHGYNPGVQEINQSLCNATGNNRSQSGASVSAYFTYGVAGGNVAFVNWLGNPSCK